MKSKISFIGILIFFLIGKVIAHSPSNNVDVNFPYKNMPEVFPGTKLLTYKGDISAQMLDGAHKFIDGYLGKTDSHSLVEKAASESISR